MLVDITIHEVLDTRIRTGIIGWVLLVVFEPRCDGSLYRVKVETSPLLACG